MKPTFKYTIQGYSGKCDGLVYYYHSKLRRTICRKLPKSVHLKQHDMMRVISQRLRSLELSEGFQNDLKLYVVLYSHSMSKRSKALSSWYSAYLMLMWAMANKYDTDLATISREQIEKNNLPCLSVQRAIEAELLPAVRDYAILNQNMFS